eukprot:980408_1
MDWYHKWQYQKENAKAWADVAKTRKIEQQIQADKLKNAAHEERMAKLRADAKRQEEAASLKKKEAEQRAEQARAKALQDKLKMERDHEARMTQLKAADVKEREQAQLKMEQEKAKQAADALRQKQQAEKEMMALKLEQERERARLAKEAEDAKRAHEDELAQRKAKEEAAKAQREKELQDSKQAHTVKMAEMKAQEEREKEEREREAEREKQQKEHEIRMAKMNEKKQTAKYWKQEIKKNQKKLKGIEDAHKQVIVDLDLATLDEESMAKKLEIHTKNYEENLSYITDKIAQAQLKYKESNDKIRDAINKTNVGEESIPQFLNLINDGLIVGTLNDTAKREALNAKLGAFAELFERRTNTSLAIDTFFTDKLKPFVTYLKDEQYETMDSLLCDDEKQFNEIVVIIENGIAKTNAAIEESRKKKDTLKNDVDANHKAIHIKPIRTKQKNGGPLFEELKKLCMREIAEGPKGWVTKNDGDDEVEVETIFKGKLKPFAKYLADEDYDMMDEVLCDDEYDFEEILDIIEAGIAKDKGRPLKRGTSGKETSVMRTLKQMCMKENAEEGWMKQQQAKKAIVTVQLKEVSHPLSKFFGAMDMAVTDARSCLEYSVQKTPAQQSAIEYRKKNEAKLKAIKEKAENAAPDDDDDEAKNEEPQFLAEFRESRENGLTQNPTDMDEEKAGALDLIRDESSAFVTAAILKLHVVDAVRHIFEASELPITIETGLTLAQDVENCSLQIMQSQATIRSSLLIARQLVDFKPANPGPQAAPFWRVIDKGIINIFNNYIEMVKIAATYFSYFVKFKSAFEHYASCHEIQKGDTDLVVATEYLQRDVKHFTAFKATMQAIVDKLTDDAKAVISDCVSQTSGANSFQEAQTARNNAKEELLEEQANLNRSRFALRVEYEKVYDLWKNESAKLKQLSFIKQQQEEEIRNLKEYIEKAKTILHDTSQSAPAAIAEEVKED